MLLKIYSDGALFLALHASCPIHAGALLYSPPSNHDLTRLHHPFIPFTSYALLHWSVLSSARTLHD